MASARSVLVLLVMFALGCPGSGDPSINNDQDAGVDSGNGGDRDAGTVAQDGSMGGLDADTPSCKTACDADDCGAVPDGCGDFLTCSSCTGSEVCGVLRANKCDVPPPVDCTPQTPAEACPNKCGTVGDGCSGVIDCTAANGGVDCGSDEVCGGYDGNRQDNTCVPEPTCTSQTCGDLGVTCGMVGDGCGNVLDCTAETGGCIAPQVCGTGSESGTCVAPACTPTVITTACAGTCGIVDDGCGNQLDCEGNAATRCPAGETCGGGGVPGQCGASVGCTPIPVGTACAGKCGVVSDGCGNAYACESGNGGQTCNAAAGESCGAGGVPNECGVAPCTPRTQGEACPSVGGYDTCGQQPDGCGGLIDCGSCGAGQQCGLDTPNRCGDIPVCTATPVTTACAGKCGVVPDGCGGSYTCTGANGGVTCTGDAFCGALAPNECGTPPETCTPQTCASLGHSCGLASDGCGNVINCWSGCSESDPSCTGDCGNFAACLADPGNGSQSCVVGETTCTGALCDDVPTGCSAGSPTRLVGTVLTPGRLSGGTRINTVPVPNAIVYIPADPSVALPTIFQGVDASNPASCGRCEDEELVADGQSVLAAAVTDYRGDFVLEGSIPTGVPFNLVIKIGKWRRVVQVANGVAQACTTRSLSFDDTHLAANSSDGLAGTQLPRVAVSTGWVDEMECVFRNIGIDESEFTAPNQSGRIHLYRANGARVGTQANDLSVPDSNLYSSQSTLNSYDLIVWDCEGSEQQHNTHDPKIEAYVNAGGRMFASHYSYAWIEGNGSLDNSADWYTSGSAGSDTAYVSLPTGPTARTGANPVKSVVLRDWLDWQGALTGTAAGLLDSPSNPRFGVADPRDRAGASVGSSTDEWIYRTTNSSSAGPRRVQQLSFNTPYGANDDNICGRVAYSGFHVADANNDDDDDYFPGVCSNGELSTQEKVLVFMLFDLATCVSAGDPPTPPSCTPSTAAELCPTVNDACGFLADGCGGVVDCGGCGTGFYCDGATCRPQECTPASCASLGYTCGDHADGCGGVARNGAGVEGCGDCSDGQICSLNSPGACGGCVQIPMGDACPAGSCGTVSDGCGGTYDCGSCPSGQVCGGAGANLCGSGNCTAIPEVIACFTLNCGIVSDGCGGSYNCGMCTPPETCGGGGQPNVCGQVLCTPIERTTACAGLECGFVGDGCGGSYSCGSCPDGRVCGGAGPNLCGASCTPTTCAAQGAECGSISDQCGGILNCGSCPGTETCGAGGPNVCGGGQCTPSTCAAQSAECGLIGDSCGGVLDCGVCTEPGESCGGAGVANQCGTGEGGCNPTTCAAEGVECGQISDGCGGLVDCGNCPSGFACRRSMCELVLI